MSKRTTYVFIGDHAESLASGGRIGPGDEVPESALDLSDPGDARLLADGVLVEPHAGAVPAASDDLEALKRTDLNVRAAALGVEDPDKLPNKDAVIAAIREKENVQ